MFSDEEFTTFSNKVANIKDKEKVRELAEDYAYELMVQGRFEEEQFEEMVELLLENRKKYSPQRIAGKGKKSEKKGLEDSLKDLLATIGSFQFYSGRTKVDQNIATSKLYDQSFVENIELPSDIDAPDQDDIISDIFESDAADSIKAIASLLKEKEKHDGMLAGLRKKLLEEVKLAQAKGADILIKPADLSAFYTSSPKYSESERKKYYKMFEETKGSIKELNDLVKELKAAVEALPENKEKGELLKLVKQMLDADMEFIVDFETAEFAVYDVDIAKGRALELMLMLAELIKDSTEFTMGIDRGFTADDGSKASDVAVMEVTRDVQRKISKETERITLDPLSFIAFNSQLQKIRVKRELGGKDTKQEISEYLSEQFDKISRMEGVIKNQLFEAKEKVLELIEEYEDFAEEYYGSDDDEANPLPIYFLDVDVIRDNFENYSAEVIMDNGELKVKNKGEIDPNGPNDFLNAFTDFIVTGSTGGLGSRRAGKGMNTTSTVSPTTMEGKDGMDLVSRRSKGGFDRLTTHRLDTTEFRQLDDEVRIKADDAKSVRAIVSSMQPLIKKIFIDLPRKSAQLPIEYPFKVDMGKALSQMEGELPDEASLRLDVVLSEGPERVKKNIKPILKFLETFKSAGTKNVKELIRDGEKYVKAMGRFFRYTRGTSQYKDIQKETAQLIRAATKGQPAAQGLSFMGIELKEVPGEKPTLYYLKELGRQIRRRSSQFPRVNNKKNPAIKAVELLEDMNILSEVRKSEIHEKLLNAHDELRILKGEEVFFAMLRTDNLDDILTIQKTLYEENLDVSAGEITNIVKSLDSHASISKEYGIPTESVYIIKSHFR
mgnify:CR=1 FL=1